MLARLLNILIPLTCAMLIMAQRDEYNYPLFLDFKGLALVSGTLALTALWHAVGEIIRAFGYSLQLVNQTDHQS